MLVDRGSGDVPTLLNVSDGDLHCLLFSFTESVSRSVNPVVYTENMDTCSPVNMLLYIHVCMSTDLHAYMYMCFFLKKFKK